MTKEIWIYDAIGDDQYGVGVTPTAVRDEIRKASPKDRLLLRLNSPGGDVFAAVAIRQHLAEHKGGYDVQVDGLAASAATFFLTKGAHVAMATGSRIMIHQPWGVAIGNSNEMRGLASVLDGIGDDMVAAYSERTGRDAEEIRAIMNAETYFGADDAIAYGFADEKLGMTIAASATQATRADDAAAVIAARTKLHIAAMKYRLDRVAGRM